MCVMCVWGIGVWGLWYRTVDPQCSKVGARWVVNGDGSRVHMRCVCLSTTFTHKGTVVFFL